VPLDNLQFDDAMSLSGLRLISLDAGTVRMTPRDKRFPAFSLESATH